MTLIHQRYRRDHLMQELKAAEWDRDWEAAHRLAEDFMYQNRLVKSLEDVCGLKPFANRGMIPVFHVTAYAWNDIKHDMAQSL